MEYGWVLNHEDLELTASAIINTGTPADPYGPDHGTAVLGEIGGKRNGYGVTGITPAARMLVAAANTTEYRYSPERAITLAAGALDPGDVILIEQQFPACNGSDYGPLEWYLPVFDAIANATAQGIIVVEAAGNGSVFLDSASCNGRFDRSQWDSGAIIVGAGSPQDRSRKWFSSYGSRVDVQGWGSGVMTSGYGDGFNGGGDPRQTYTPDFGGTSSASPIVASGVVALQGALKARGLALASPAEMRSVLAATGTPQTGTENIGPLPNLPAAWEELLERRTGGSGWKAWAGRGGNLLSFPECELTGGRIDCWARSGSSTLIWNRSNDGSSWLGWTDLGGSVGAAPECLVRGSRMDCFVTTTQRRFAQITHDGTAWGRWTDRGGSLSDRPSCVPGTGLVLDCFATGTDKALYRLPFNGTAWRPFEKVGGSTALRPECVARAGGIDCFIVDTSRNLKVVRLSNGKWSTFKKLAGSVGIPPHCLVSGNRMDCFAQSSSGGLLKAGYNGSSWSSWANAGGRVGSQPYCSRVTDGVDCFWTTPDFKLVQRQLRGGSWRPEADLGGPAQQRPICLSQDGGGRIDCLVRGTDNSLRQRTYD